MTRGNLLRLTIRVVCSSLTVFAVPCASQLSQVCAEQIELDFRKVNSDPLVDYTAPSSGGDRAVVTPQGLRVIQRAAAAGGPPPRDTGAKFLVSSSGDFEVAFDFKVLKLEEPKTGWGQGLLFTIELDDLAGTDLQMAMLAAPGKGARLRTVVQTRRPEEADRVYHTESFTDGRFIVSRNEEEAIFAIESGTKRKELRRVPCPRANVRSISVWCTRLPEGSTRAEFLLRSATVNSDAFFAFQAPRNSGWSWWSIIVATQFGILAFLVAFKWYRSATT